MCFVFWVCVLVGGRLGGLCRGCYVWRSFCGWVFVCVVAPFSFFGGCYLGVCSGCRVGFVGVVFVVCGVWVAFLVSLVCISLCVSLACVAWVGWVGVFWGYGCGVLVFCFWRFLCLLVVVFCLVLVL